MTLLGLINNHGEPIRFADIPKSFDRADWPGPLPVVLTLARQKTIYHDFLAKYNELNKGNSLRLIPSVTQLIKPPRVAAMEKVYDYFEDPKSMVKREMGTMKHGIIENNVADLRENGHLDYASEVSMLHPLYDDNYVPCTIDLIQKSAGIIDDWKFSSAYKIRLARDAANWEIGGKLEEWTLQLNFYRLACHVGSLYVEKTPTGEPTGNVRKFRLAITKLYLTIWQTDDRDEVPMESFEVPMLPLEQVREYFIDRAEAHAKAEALARDCRRGALPEAAFQAALEPCSERDQWRKAPAYAVAKPGSKSALKVFYADSEGGAAVAKHNAEALAEEKNLEVDQDRSVVEWDEATCRFGVRKNKNKRPTKWFDCNLTTSEDVDAEKARVLVEAEAFAAAANAKLEYYGVDHRPGEPIRCADFCPAGGVCRQFAAEAKGTEALARAQARWRTMSGQKAPEAGQ